MIDIQPTKSEEKVLRTLRKKMFDVINELKQLRK